MNRILHLLRHHSNTNRHAAVATVEACIAIHGSNNCNGNPPFLLTSRCSNLPIHLQRRSMVTNRRQQRRKASANAKGNAGGGHPPKRRGSRGNDRRRGHRHGGEPEAVIRPPKNYLEKLPKPKEQLLQVPPALLAPTASPYVYISQTALGGDYEDDEFDEQDDDDTPLDPSTLFAEVYHTDTGAPTLPPVFAKGDFRYFSPKHDLNYDYPKHGLPEIAFLGRSNVGKSSLINSIMRKNLCLTSRVPGRTQLPYYYGLIPKATLAEQQQQQQQQQHRRQKKGASAERIDPGTLQGYIVDLPGYGYGRAPTNITEDWQKDTQELLLHRRHEAGVLQRLFLLMDARRGMEGPNEHDRIVMRWLEDAEIPFTIVLTKADRVSVPLVVKQVNDFCLRYASQQQHQSVVAQSPVIHVTSSARGWGIHELMLSIETEFLGGNDEEENDAETDFL